MQSEEKKASVYISVRLSDDDDDGGGGGGDDGDDGGGGDDDCTFVKHTLYRSQTPGS